jgi:hypothetical protein
MQSVGPFMNPMHRESLAHGSRTFAQSSEQTFPSSGAQIPPSHVLAAVHASPVSVAVDSRRHKPQPSVGSPRLSHEKPVKPWQALDDLAGSQNWEHRPPSGS